ncbi:MAG: 4-hydroxy-tetrahydrodipicolinate reductase [Chloroflexi bacterium]|nr:4-hydroxy-tetrahydrodipicolinate reductase [Chloroflexota bacterium]
MFRVAVLGSSGQMGQAVVAAVEGADDLELVARINRVPSPGSAPFFTEFGKAVEAASPEVVVDFSVAEAAADHALEALDAGVSPVIGTTGMSHDQVAAIRERADATGMGAFIAPNFAIGAVLMMQMAAMAAPHLDSVEVIELHHDRKRDAPSGTAARTAELIVRARGGHPAQDAATEAFTLEGVRGGVRGGVRVHSVRLPGLVAHQEVIFGGEGQTLTIRHDSTSRESFMPGVLLAVRQVRGLSGLVIGLEHLLTSSEGEA